MEDAVLAAVLAEGLVGAEMVSSVRALIRAAAQCMLLNLEEGICVADGVAAHASSFGHCAVRAELDLATAMKQCVTVATALSTHLLDDALSDPSTGTPAAVSALFAGFSSMTTALAAALSETYLREATSRRSSMDQRRRVLVRLLLAGKHVDSATIEHPLGATHVGIVGHGERAPELIRRLASVAAASSLLIAHDDGCVWAWLSRTGPVLTRDLAAALRECADCETKLAIGEPAPGLGGFRLTHRQAKLALAVARLQDGVTTRYIDVTLLAHAVQDDTLSRSLMNAHLLPLGGGATLRETLRAYFKAGRNVSAAAAMLGVDRSTVRNRLDTIEQRLGRTLYAHQAELEVALSLDRLTREARPDESKLPSQ